MKFIPFLVIVVGSLLALYLGATIGETNVFALKILIALMAMILAVIISNKYLVFIAIIIATLDLWAAPLGFKTQPLEQIIGLSGLLFIAVVWHRSKLASDPYSFEGMHSYSIFRVLTYIACVYAGLHFLYNMFFPYALQNFGIQGASKTYLQVYGGFLLIILGFHFQLFRKIEEKSSIMLFYCFCASFLCLSIIHAIGTIRYGLAPLEQLDAETVSNLRKAFHVPVLEVWNNFFTMRIMGPIASMICSVMLFFPINRKVSIISFITLLFSVGGSAASGGRASIIFSIGFIILVAFISNKKAIGIAITGALILCTSILLVLPASMIEMFPWNVQRSIALIRPNDLQAGRASILHSSQERQRWFDAAIHYWSSGDMRLLLTGHSVTSMDQRDHYAFAMRDNQARLQFGIRRLATHNVISDLLLGWGIIGYLLNISVWISCIFFLFNLRRLQSGSQMSRNWTLGAILGLSFYVAYSHLGGSWIWPICIVFTITAMAHTLPAAREHEEASND